MKTLIELYDDRPIENVLATEVFQPERTVFLCPAEIARDKRLQEKLNRYFSHLGLHTEAVFTETDMFNAAAVLHALRTVLKQYEDCVLDITGGTDAALFAAGRLSAETELSAITYSRKKNCFYNIHKAAFADSVPCRVRHSVEDCFLMAGGCLRSGRVENSVLADYADRLLPFFRLYLRFRTRWTSIIKYIQLASQPKNGEKPTLAVNAASTLKTERGGKVGVPADCLKELEALGFLRDFRQENGRVSFSFADEHTRAWLRDIGSVLELYVYSVCKEPGIFNDVIVSAVVDWEGNNRHGDVTNEIDVMAMQGVLPLFISCKTCAVSTEALNELAILRNRFGGHSAKAAIVTAKSCNAITRQRASELQITVIDLNDLKQNRLGKLLAAKPQ